MAPCGWLFLTQSSPPCASTTILQKAKPTRVSLADWLLVLFFELRITNLASLSLALTGVEKVLKCCLSHRLQTAVVECLTLPPTKLFRLSALPE
jgi:hypothetical protein